MASAGWTTDPAIVREEAIWVTLFANDVKTVIRILGIIDIIVTIVLLIFLFFGLIPLVPPALLEYGALYHAPHLFWGALAIVVSGSKSPQLFSLAALLGIVVTVLDLIAFVLLIIWFVGCVTGSPLTFITDCVISVLARITVLVAALFLLIFSIVILAKAFGMVRYVRDMRLQNARTRAYEKTKES